MQIFIFKLQRNENTNVAKFARRPISIFCKTAAAEIDILFSRLFRSRSSIGCNIDDDDAKNYFLHFPFSSFLLLLSLLLSLLTNCVYEGSRP